MGPETRKRLESAGWKSGHAQDFLKLTDAEAEMIERKLALLQERRVPGDRHPD